MDCFAKPVPGEPELSSIQGRSARRSSLAVRRDSGPAQLTINRTVRIGELTRPAVGTRAEEARSGVLRAGVRLSSKGRAICENKVASSGGMQHVEIIHLFAIR